MYFLALECTDTTSEKPVITKTHYDQIFMAEGINKSSPALPFVTNKNDQHKIYHMHNFI